MPVKGYPSCAARVALLAIALPFAAHAQVPTEESAFTAPIVDNRETPWVEVQADKYAWQSSGVLAQQGDTYLVTATGQWKVAPVCSPSGPEGRGIYSLTCWDIGGQILPGYSHGALIGRLGRNGQPFYVGANYRFTAQSTDLLYFMMNDNPLWFGDNSGSMKVVVNLISRAPQQQPAPVLMQPVIPVVPVMPVQPGQVLRGGGGGGRAPQ